MDSVRHACALCSSPCKHRGGRLWCLPCSLKLLWPCCPELQLWLLCLLVDSPGQKMASHLSDWWLQLTALYPSVAHNLPSVVLLKTAHNKICILLCGWVWVGKVSPMSCNEISFLWRCQGREGVMSTFHDGINSHIIHASLALLSQISIKPSRRICTFSRPIIPDKEVITPVTFAKPDTLGPLRADINRNETSLSWAGVLQWPFSLFFRLLLFLHALCGRCKETGKCFLLLLFWLP